MYRSKSGSICYCLFLELLPGIEEFLVKALARERLAASTEKKRLFFIERLEVIKMPASLHPGQSAVCRLPRKIYKQNFCPNCGPRAVFNSFTVVHRIPLYSKN